MALSLDGLLDVSVAHEAIPSPIDARLRAGAWTGLGLLAFGFFLRAWTARHFAIGAEPPAVFILGWGLVRAVFPEGVAGWANLILLASAAVGGGVLAYRTRGFTEARHRDQVLSFALLVIGMLAMVPFVVFTLVLLFNLVLIAVLITLILAVVIGIAAELVS